MMKTNECIDEITLKKVQSELLIIAKEIKRVCDENDINYFLVGGTLIGAVRHNGFIPWDDDLDIGMMREDFDRFVKIAPEKIGDEFFVQTWESDSEFGYAFAKVRMNGTVYRELNDSRKKKNQGFYVDILPYDNIPSDETDLRIMSNKIMKMRMLMLMKNRMTIWRAKKSIIQKALAYCVYVPKRINAMFWSRNRLIREYNKVMRQYDDVHTDRVCQESGGARFGKYPIMRNYVESYVYLPFEDTDFKCPREYDIFLKSIYGDYMKLPPVNEQVCRHGIIEIKFRGDK